MSDGFAALPPPRPGCRLTVAIPARNEARLVAGALRALAAQRALDGRPLAPELFEVIVLANDCGDRTAAVARAAAVRGGPAVHVVEAALPAAAAHVGTARKLVMDGAARRFERAGRNDALIASTDADTQVAPDWIAWTLAEARTADAVTGRIGLAPHDRDALGTARALYLCEAAYREAVAALEALRDPRPEDPWPRHGQHFGASFAVRLRAYRAAGGVPPLPALEDVALYAALLRIDARVRHSPHVRVRTSARLDARAAGGFATFLSDLGSLGRRGAAWLVDDPRETLARIDARAALRRIWHGTPRPGDAGLASAAFGLTAERWRTDFDRTVPFGLNHERLSAATAANPWRRYAPVPVSEALAALRPLLGSANAVRPTRSSAASGAG